jgi:polar amino acid transport system permease protein
MNAIIESFPYLMVGPYPEGAMGGLALTVWLSIVISAAGLTFGICVAGLSLAPSRWIRLLGLGLTFCIRGVPSVAFLFWMYFLIPRLLEIDLTPFQSVALALAIYQGAYMAEDIRGGFKAVATGQWEAGRATGLGTLALLSHIVFPQAIRAVIPALINRFVNLFMYTSIASLVGIIELTRAAVIVNNRELIYPIEIFGFIGLIYFLFCYAITRIGRHIEQRWTWAPKLKNVQTST